MASESRFSQFTQFQRITVQRLAALIRRYDTKIEDEETDINGREIKAFENGNPSAHVVRLPHANHGVFLSNEEDVLREMNAFISSLPQ